MFVKVLKIGSERSKSCKICFLSVCLHFAGNNLAFPLNGSIFLRFSSKGNP